MNEVQLLGFKLRMESLITERETMIAMNQYRTDRGETIAYGESEFWELKRKFDVEYKKFVNLR